MLLVVAIWGSTFVVVKDALADATPLAFNLVRMAFAFLILAVAYRRHWREVTRSQLIAGAVVGFFLAMGYQFQTAGLVKTTPSKSAFITGMVVVLVPLFSAIRFLRPPGAKAPRWNAYVGAILAFGGILLLTLPATAKGLLPDFTNVNIGDLLTIAWHSVMLRHGSSFSRWRCCRSASVRCLWRRVCRSSSIPRCFLRRGFASRWPLLLCSQRRQHFRFRAGHSPCCRQRTRR
jgi:hypothetical protein